MADPHSPPTTFSSVSVHPSSHRPSSAHPPSSSRSRSRKYTTASDSSPTTRTSQSSVSPRERLAELRMLHLVEVQRLPAMHAQVVDSRLLGRLELVEFDYEPYTNEPSIYQRQYTEQVYDFLVNRHPTLLSHPSRPRVTLLACSLFYAPQLFDLSIDKSNETLWSDVVLGIATELVNIVDNAIVSTSGTRINEASWVGKKAIPLCFEKEYYAVMFQSNIVGLYVTHGTIADFSFGISKHGFQIWNRSSMMLVDVGTLFGRQQNPDGIYLRLDGNNSDMIFPFLFTEIKGYSQVRTDGSQRLSKDGRPQAYQAMMAGLVLYEYTRNLAKIKSPVEYQLWENETTIEDMEMLKRSYGVVAHQSDWYFFTMVLCTNTNAEDVDVNQFQITQIARKDVSDVSELHAFLEIMRIALSEVFDRKRMLQRLLSMLTEPDTGHQPPGTSGQPTVPTPSASFTPYPEVNIQQSLPGPSGTTTSTGHLNMPWQNIQDPKRRKKMLIGWWQNGGREWSLREPTPSNSCTTLQSISSPPISPVPHDGKRSPADIAMYSQATYHLTQQDDDNNEHVTY